MKPIGYIFFFLFLSISSWLFAQSADSTKSGTDSVKVQTYANQIRLILSENTNFKSLPPKAYTIIPKRNLTLDFIFYLILTVTTFLGIFRIFYFKYFTTLFRVFFNTSLRQNQLTDQLIQAKLPSLLLNIIAALIGGIFTFLLLNNINDLGKYQPIVVIGVSALFLIALYFLKYVGLKFIGWITGYKELTNTYIFIVFLINKIIGIILLPVIVIMAFSVKYIASIFLIVAIVLVLIMFFLRFARSYGSLKHYLKVNRVHFFMYLFGIEILPVLLIYKGLILLLSKNL